MEKEVISQKQAIVILSAFFIGSSVILGVGTSAKQDIWIANILAMIMGGIIFIVYARIVKLFPCKGLYEIIDLLFGKVLGRIISLAFIWYAFHLGALVIRNFSEFIHTVSLSETPLSTLAFMMGLAVIWAVRGGLELIGRWISIFLPIVIIVSVVITFLSAPQMEFSFLKPILYNGWNPVLEAAYTVFAFPFAEAILFTTLMGSLTKNSSPYKVYFLSLLIGGGIIISVSLRTLLTLGIGNISILNYSAYSAVSLINIGNFIQRIEVSVSVVFIFCGFIKVCTCLFAVTKGIAAFFNIKDYHRIVAPFGLLMVIFSLTIYKNAMEMTEWAEKIYPYYAIPFQILLPLIIWITAEIKTRLAKKNDNKVQAEQNA